MQKMNPDTDLLSFTKINSKLIIDLKVKSETMKILEDNIEEYLDDLHYNDDLWYGKV